MFSDIPFMHGIVFVVVGVSCVVVTFGSSSSRSVSVTLDEVFVVVVL